MIDGVFDHKSYTEKSLARMIKAKAKAERAAARQAMQASLVAAHLVSPQPSTPTPNEEGPVEVNMTDTPQEPDEPAPNATPDRTELLRSKPAVVGRFMKLTVPILIDVYAASVITPVRVKTLTGLLKAVSFLDADGLKGVLSVCSYKCSSFFILTVSPIVCTCRQLCFVYPLFKGSSVSGDWRIAASRSTVAKGSIPLQTYIS